ncbi:hypothetical protein Taro_018832, partial [Colocasia esculenta]|nr:hypothetical protein [Colocasia esculenta]
FPVFLGDVDGESVNLKFLAAQQDENGSCLLPPRYELLFRLFIGHTNGSSIMQRSCWFLGEHRPQLRINLKLLVDQQDEDGQELLGLQMRQDYVYYP